jgi:universal stress protein A
MKLSDSPLQHTEDNSKVLTLFRLKKILVPVDFSDCSKKALMYAVALARQFGAEITLLHVIPAAPPVPEFGSVDLVSADEAQTELKKTQALIADAVPSRILVKAGEPCTQIVAMAGITGSDLIIISTRGRTGLARVFAGSTAEKVVRHAGCPVLVVRPCEHEFVSAG